MNKLEACKNGFTLILSLNISYESSNEKLDTGYRYGRTVLLSSSNSDNPYSSGGFFLHQLNAREEYYLQFGLTNFDDLYSAKIYVNDKSTIRLSFVWDVSSKGLKIFVDGNHYETLSIPTKRSYFGLNFNPFKKLQTLMPVSTQTQLNMVFFNDTSLSLFEKEIKGDLDDYFFGCYALRNEIEGSIEIFVNVDCKSKCFELKSQLFLIQSFKCVCIKNKNKLEEYHNQVSDCSSDSIWKAYVVSNLNFDSETLELNLNVEKLNWTNSVQVGETLGLKVESSNSQNYELVLAFEENIAKKAIGNSYLFHEYTQPGSHKLILTATSLSDSSKRFHQEFPVEVTEILTYKPMAFVYLASQVIGEKQVQVKVEVEGGHPYTCVLNFGYSNNKMNLNSAADSSVFRVNLTYSFTGLYNISVGCSKNRYRNDSVADWSLVYLPRRSVGAFASNEYGLGIFKEMNIQNSNRIVELPLEIPIEKGSVNIKFEIFNVIDDLKLFEWTQRNESQSINSVLNSNLLSALKHNYLSVVSNGLNLGTYLIAKVEELVTEPSIELVNTTLRYDLPMFFDFSIKQAGILKVDFGNKKPFLLFQINQPTVLRLSNVYSRESVDYTMKATLVNEISKQETSYRLLFDLGLPTFRLIAQSNASDINQPVTFRLTLAEIPNQPVEVSEVRITFDSEFSNTWKSYTFDQSNQYSLTATYRFKSYGFFYPIANCSNSISFSVSRTMVRVGENLNTASVIILNNYANINEFVNFNLTINGGNGYNVTVDFRDSRQLVLPPRFLASKGSVPFSTDLPVRIRFFSNIVQISYMYRREGEYNPTITIQNPFGILNVRHCAPVFIQPLPKPYASTDNCVVASNNVALKINGEDFTRSI